MKTSCRMLPVISRGISNIEHPCELIYNLDVPNATMPSIIHIGQRAAVNTVIGLEQSLSSISIRDYYDYYIEKLAVTSFVKTH